ncbi:MAG: putative Ig domain-containing protein [Terracidiphilus sp.]|nr:putative Ig domain-containing protein [Terracidiphilus sp.]
MFWKKTVLSIGLAIFAAFSLSGCGGGSKPVGVAVSASATTVDATNSVTLTATVTNDKNAAGVSWSVSGGGTLSNQTTTSATYTAPSTNAASLSVTVTATSIADATKTASAALTVPATPTITTAALAAGTVGTAYSATLAGSGGITPYIWSVNTGSALPACLTMTTAGVISGTPVASCTGTSSITFKLTDSGTATALTITKALSLTINAAPAITFTSATMPAATYNVVYAGSAAATGGAGTLAYSLSSGPLPTGLSLNASTGAITGTPAVVGTFPITVKAADAYGDSATQTYSIVSSYPALAVATSTLPNGYVGSTYTKTLLATGGSGTGYVWSVASGSTLPAGLTLSGAGILSGTPTTAGTPSFTVSVTDSVSNPAGTATLSMTIKPAVSVTTSTPLPTGYVGSAYTKSLAATGGADAPYTWTVTAGSTLPAGLTLSTAGVLSGTPTATGTPSFSVTATDSVGNTGSATLAMTISPGITISTATLPGGYQGTAYPGATLAASGGTNTGLTWAVASGSALPAGLSLSAGGVISGTPTGSGTTNVAITVTDSASNTATKTFSIAIEATLTVSSPNTLTSGTANVAYSNQLTATGGSGTYSTWAITSGSGTLTPLSLSLSTAGVLSGTPTAPGTATFTVQVTDSESHTATATLSVSIYNVLTITTASLPNAFVGTAYNQTLVAGGGSGTGYTWTTTASTLSTYGLALSTAGVITGTPTQAGTASLTAKVTDSNSNTATASFTFTIYAALTLSTPSSTMPGPAIRGEVYDGQIVASGGSGTYSFVTTVLPTDGLAANISGAVLHVAGTPTTATTVTFTVTLTDTVTSQSVGPYTYTIVVSEPATLTLPTPNPSSLPSATNGQSYSGAINATGGASPYTWTVNGTPGNGPVNLGNGTLAASNSSGNTLSISGMPSSTGSVSFTAAIKDNLNTTVSNTYTISVNAAGSQVSGSIYMSNYCGSVTMPTITVSINTSPVQTTTTDSNGNYSFASIPNGNYIITPSISGPTSAFYPATQSITVNNSTVNVSSFNVALGYTISGTVSYAGSKTGRVYLMVNNTSCSNNSGPGTSLSAAGTYTIRGVPPGTYTVSGWMDTLGFGATNANGPSGSSSSLTISGANATGANLTLTDPSAITLSTAPKLQAAIGFNLGVVLAYKPILNSNNVELATSYTVQWSTDSSFGTVTGTKTFKATGDGKDVWIITPLTSGQLYYFRAQGATATSTSSWSSVVSATIAAPTSGNTISGTVTFTGAATGPLAVGFMDQTNKTMYATAIASPVSPQAYSVKVPTGSNYFFFGIIDQNNDGLIDAGDITNVNDNSSSVVSISADATKNLTLSAAGANATVTTQHWQQTGSNTGSGYTLNIQTREGNKLPVAATIVSGPNVNYPLDLGACTDCGTPQFYTNIGINSVRPTTSDSYGILVTYSDTTTETLTATVSAVLDAFPTNLAPITGSSTSTTPTFTWTDPASPSSYVYVFSINDNNGNEIWQIPSNNSNSYGLPYTTTSIAWPTDPTDSSNTPSVSSLSTSTTYNWQVQAVDSNGNSAMTQVSYKP